MCHCASSLGALAESSVKQPVPDLRATACVSEQAKAGAGDDPVPSRNGAGRNLAREKTDSSDAIKQVAMADGVRTIDSVGEDGDRVATRREGGLV